MRFYHELVKLFGYKSHFKISQTKLVQVWKTHNGCFLASSFNSHAQTVFLNQFPANMESRTGYYISIDFTFRDT